MPLETGSFISDLNASNPAHTDGLNQADAHIRLVKALVKATFPNITGAVTATQAELNELTSGVLGLADGTSSAPSVSFASEATLGLYRASAGHIDIAGRLAGNGALATGQIVQFPKAPSSLATGGTATGAEQFVEMDGSTYNVSTFPDLGAFLGSTFGGNGVTTFAVPNVKDTGRFLRSRTGTLAVGSSQANAFKSHVHTVSVGTDGAHAHTISDPGHTHAVTNNPLSIAAGGSGTYDSTGTGQFNNAIVGTASATTGITILSTGSAHTHSVTINAASDGGDTETRPESFVVVMALKT